MWMVNGQVINRQRNFTDGNGHKQRGIILVKWTKEALAEIGVKPFVEVSYDKKLYKSTGYSDADVAGVATRTHTTEDRYTLAEAKVLTVEQLNSMVYQLLQKTDYYVTRKSDVGTAIPQDIIDERAQIRTDITTNENSINALSVYADVMNFDITFTGSEQIKFGVK